MSPRPASPGAVRAAAAAALALTGAAVPAAADAAVTSTVSGSTLTVSGDGADDSIVVACQANLAKVNGADPAGGPIACASVCGLVVAAGGGADDVDLSAMTGFPALAGTDLRGDAGDDSIDGSPYADTIRPGAGSDDVDGKVGANTVVLAFDGSATLQLGSFSAAGEADQLAGFDLVSVTSGTGDDTLDAATAGRRVTWASGDGWDTFFTPAGVDDTLIGGTGSDLVSQSVTDDAVLLPGAYLAQTGGVTTETTTLSDVEFAEALGDSSPNAVDAGAAAGIRLFADGGGSGDTIVGGPAVDTIFGGAGVDRFRQAVTEDTFVAGPNLQPRNEITSGVEQLELQDDGGSHTLDGRAWPRLAGWSVVLSGNGGDDTLLGGATGFALLGGLGADAATVEFGGTIRPEEGVLDTVPGATTFTDLERLSLAGGTGDDAVISGPVQTPLVADLGAGDDRFDGGDGPTTVEAGAGDDTLTGGFGSDELRGGVGDDRLRGRSGADLLDGGSGVDTLRDLDPLTTPGSLADGALDAGGATDALARVEAVSLRPRAAFDASAFSGRVTLDAATSPAGVALTGARGDDVLVGSQLDDTLSGGPGSDDVDGRLGADLLRDAGVRGTVVLRPGALSDATGTDTLTSVSAAWLTASADADVLDASAADLPVTLDGAGGDDVLTPGAPPTALVGGDGSDAVAATGAALGLTGDALSGVGDPDPVSGLERAALTGTDGDDVLDASAFGGAVTLLGGAGDDALLGGPLADLLDSGAGRDVLTAGAGNDTVRARHATPTIVSCGDGADSVQRDLGLDALTGCETLDPADPPVVTPRPAPRAVTVRSLAPTKTGFRLVLRCPAGTSCRTTVSATHRRGSRTVRAIAPVTRTVRGGRALTLTAKLTPAAAKELRANKRLRVTVRVALRGGTTVSRTVTLRT